MACRLALAVLSLIKQTSLETWDSRGGFCELNIMKYCRAIQCLKLTCRSDSVRESSATITALVVQTTRWLGCSLSTTLSQSWSHFMHHTDCWSGKTLVAIHWMYLRPVLFQLSFFSFSSSFSCICIGMLISEFISENWLSFAKSIFSIIVLYWIVQQWISNVIRSTVREQCPSMAPCTRITLANRTSVRGKYRVNDGRRHVKRRTHQATVVHTRGAWSKQVLHNEAVCTGQ